MITDDEDVEFLLRRPDICQVQSVTRQLGQVLSYVLKSTFQLIVQLVRGELFRISQVTHPRLLRRPILPYDVLHYAQISFHLGFGDFLVEQRIRLRLLPKSRGRKLTALAGLTLF